MHAFSPGLIWSRSDRSVILSFLLLHDTESDQPGMIPLMLLPIFQTMQKTISVIYFEAVDTMTGCIKQRFDQPG